MPPRPVSTVNRVRYRMTAADADWQEALEQLRAAATAPDYCGPVSPSRPGEF